MANGICFPEPAKNVLVFSSDGSLMEGNTAEAARIAVANNLNIKLLIDDNNQTIAGHPSEYLPGYNVGQTLRGHGMPAIDVDGENLEHVFAAMRRAMLTDGPFAVVLKRKMCPGIPGVEGTSEGHDALAAKNALEYLEARGLDRAANLIKSQMKVTDPYGQYLGCGKFDAPRQVFGQTVAEIIQRISCKEERKRRVLVVDSDLEGSCGLQK